MNPTLGKLSYGWPEVHHLWKLAKLAQHYAITVKWSCTLSKSAFDLWSRPENTLTWVKVESWYLTLTELEPQLTICALKCSEEINSYSCKGIGLGHDLNHERQANLKPSALPLAVRKESIAVTHHQSESLPSSFTFDRRHYVHLRVPNPESEESTVVHYLQQSDIDTTVFLISW